MRNTQDDAAKLPLALAVAWRGPAKAAYPEEGSSRANTPAVAPLCAASCGSPAPLTFTGPRPRCHIMAAAPQWWCGDACFHELDQHSGHSSRSESGIARSSITDSSGALLVGLDGPKRHPVPATGPPPKLQCDVVPLFPSPPLPPPAPARASGGGCTPTPG